MQWEHEYLFQLFPQYDYNNPKRPWDLHCRDSTGIRNCAWQMKAFHYWWVMKQCHETGEVGLAINIENIPFCVMADNRESAGHVFAQHGSVHKLFNGNKFPLVIASAVIPFYPCASSNPQNCEGPEVANIIHSLATTLKPDGVLIAAVMDDTGPRHEGRSLKDSAQFTHTWTAKQFERSVLAKIDTAILEVQEFDTLRNDMSYNVVLRKK